MSNRRRSQRTWLVLTAALAFTLPVWSQEQPGDPCSPDNAIGRSGGTETGGKGFLLTCQSGIWNRIYESDANANLGVKQDSPKAPLHVGGELIVGATTGLDCDADRKGGLRWNDTPQTIEMCDGANWRWIAGSAVAAGPEGAIQFNNSSALAGVGTFVYTSTGRLGMGTPRPSYPLHVAATTAEIARFESTSSQYVSIILKGTDRSATIRNATNAVGIQTAGSQVSRNGSNPSNNAFRMSNENATVFYGSIGADLAGNMVFSKTSGQGFVFSSASVGINTTTPSALLHVNAESTGTKALIVQGATSQTANLTEWQDSSGTALSFVNASGGFAAPAYCDTSGSNCFNPASGAAAAGPEGAIQFNSSSSLSGNSSFVYSSMGRVGIGTASPQGDLHVQAPANAAKLILMGGPAAVASIAVRNTAYNPTLPAAEISFDRSGAGNGAEISFSTRNSFSQFVKYVTIGVNGTVTMRAGPYSANKTLFVEGREGGISEFYSSSDAIVEINRVGPNPSYSSLVAASGGAFSISAQSSLAFVVKSAGGTSMRINDEGFVGIGTETPDAKLEINMISAGSQPGLVIRGKTPQSANFTEWQDSNGAALAFVNASGGIAAPAYCDTSGVNCFNPASGAVAAGSDRSIQFNNGSALSGDTNFVYTTDGFMGIGTNSPTSKLHVVGDLRVSGFVGNSSAIVLSVSGSYVGRNSSNRLVFGTNQPAQTVNLITPHADASSTLSYFRITPSGGDRPVFQIRGIPGQTENLQELQDSSGTILAAFSSAGSLGIGKSTPSVALDVVGDIAYTGDITDVSDRRLKKDVHPLSERGPMLDMLTRVQTYSFVMIDDRHNQTKFGVMAQELEEIFPELVRTAADELGTKSVNYIGLIPPLIRAVQEQQQTIERLEGHVRSQQEAIDQLRDQNTDLESRLLRLEKQVSSSSP